MIRLTKLALAAALGAAVTACVAVVDLPPSHPEPIVNLTQVSPDWRDPVVYGPLSVVYELSVTNPSDRTIYLRGIDVHTNGVGQYTIASQSRRLRITVPPFQTMRTRIRIAAWATGGEASAYEPVTIHGALTFDVRQGGRHRALFEAIP